MDGRWARETESVGESGGPIATGLLPEGVDIIGYTFSLGDDRHNGLVAKL